MIIIYTCVMHGSRMVLGQKNILSGGRHLLSTGRHLIYLAAATYSSCGHQINGPSLLAHAHLLEVIN